MKTKHGLKVIHIERINQSQMYVTLEVRKGVHARVLYWHDGTAYCGRKELNINIEIGV